MSKKPSDKNNNYSIEIKRHSLAHILAAAVLEMFPEAKFGVGPNIENGFYYDFDLPRTLIPEDLPLLEAAMRKIINKNLPFEHQEISHEEATKHFNKAIQKYKIEILATEAKDPKVTIYKTGDFVDLCRGPHIESAGEIDATSFKITKIAGAYWRGNEKNKMLQRIYGVAFQNKKELQEYMKRQEDAEKRDHRKLGKELGLFVFSELVGSGLPLYTWKGAIIRKEIINYSNELQKNIGYQEVHTPNMNRAELFKVSGHYEKFKDDMFKVISNYSKEEYFLKPMNCPQHTQIFASQPRTYKDLPVRISDFANLYRDEKPGELNGLSRLRCFCQDDGHAFCREDQIKNEFRNVLEAIRKALTTYKMEYKVRLSLWDPSKPEKYLGDAKVWEKAQKTLEEILIENKINYFAAIGEAAMYGPKMDIVTKDSIGREWQISTIQLDFIMPVRFGLTYVDKDGKEKIPVMVHRAIVGSPERFMGILIEHYAGAFPTWLAPVQVKILPISEKQMGYAQEILAEFKKENIRTEINENNETLGKKIRSAKMQKIPYLIVIGEKEVEEKIITVEKRGGEKGEKLELINFIKIILTEIKNRF